MIKKLTIFLTLLFLVSSAFLIRLDVFKKSTNITIDEVVYYRMGKQVSQDWTDYNTIPYGHYLVSEGRVLPEYFFQPLYKHPPLFTFLIAASINLFGKNQVSAGYISLLMGVLMIPLTYLLARLFFSRLVGFLAAFFVYIDPVSIITSQKVWPDATLAFLMVLSVYLFAYAVKRKNDLFFILCGLILGLAILTKYTAVLALFAILFYAVLYAPSKFSNRYFRLGLFGMPLIILFPWFLWNYFVYGFSSLSQHTELGLMFKNILPKISIIMVVMAGVLLYLKKKKASFFSTIDENKAANKINNVFTPLILVLLALLLHNEIIHSLQYGYIPACSWRPGFFAGAPSYFYFGRLLEFSFIYIFSFIALFSFHPKEGEGEAILRITAFIILIFFTAWRNFQSRYILASIPILLIIAVQSWTKIYSHFSGLKNMKLSIAGRLILIAVLVFIMARTFYLNTALSFTNDVCYF